MHHRQVREKNRVMQMQHASMGTAVSDVIAALSGRSDTSVNPNFIAEVLTTVRPTGYIVDSVNCLKPLIVAGELTWQDKQPIFVPSHRGFPRVRIAEGMQPRFAVADSRASRRQLACQIIRWDYLQQPVGCGDRYGDGGD